MGNKAKLPIFGEPIYRISANSFSNRIKVTEGDDISGINTFQYFAVDAIQVTGLRYVDSKMESIVINEGTDVEIVVDVNSFNKKDRHSLDIFVDAAEAYAVCRELNIQKKQKCAKVANAINMYMAEYDNIIAMSTPPKA